MNVLATKEIVLNAAQKAVLNSDEKRILILAGPGAGKTLVLKEWIEKKLLEDARKSFKILGLTFTNKAAEEMNARLSEQLLEQPFSKRLNLITFHSFGTSVLRQYGYYIGIQANFNICSDIEEQTEILKVSLKKTNIEGDYNWKKCLNAISSLKKVGYSPDEGELKEEKLSLLNTIYKAYEKELQKSGYVDYDDLLLKTFKLFKAYPALAKHFQKIYPYICVDELQDTNAAQYLILSNLINESTNLLAVGDDNQVIYEWNGADHKRLKSFKEDFKPQIIHLPLNYRCPKCIVEISNKLMVQNKIRLETFQPNIASCPEEGIVELKNFGTFQQESIGIANCILEKHHGNFGQITILARRKKLLDKVAEVFTRKKIPHRLYARKGEFISAPVAWLHEVLRLFNEPDRERSMKLVIGTFNQIANLDINFSEIEEQKTLNNTSLLSIWLNEINERLQLKKSSFGELISLVETTLGIKSYKQFYLAVFRWFDNYEKEHSEDDTKKLIYNFDEYKEEKQIWYSLANSIFNRLGSEIPISTFLQELSLTTKETPPQANEVCLMTIHASKGQGFEYVYLIGMVDDELPSYHAIKSNKNEVIEEERRNCYVAITRASKTLTLSYANTYFGWQKKPSRFLRDMELI